MLSRLIFDYTLKRNFADPIIASNSAIRKKLEPGEYFWCACGKSKDQPLCDGSHEGTEFQPVKFEVFKSKLYKLCGCKITKNPPWCDNTHSDLPQNK